MVPKFTSPKKLFSSSCTFSCLFFRFRPKFQFLEILFLTPKTRSVFSERRAFNPMALTHRKKYISYHDLVHIQANISSWINNDLYVPVIVTKHWGYKVNKTETHILLPLPLNLFPVLLPEWHSYKTLIQIMLLCCTTSFNGFLCLSELKPKALLQTTRPWMIQNPHWPSFLMTCYASLQSQWPCFSSNSNRPGTPRAFALTTPPAWNVPQLFEVYSQKAPSHRSHPWLLFLKFKPLPLDIFLSSSMPFVFQFCHLLVHSVFYQFILYTTYLSPRKHTPQRPGFFFGVFIHW